MTIVSLIFVDEFQKCSSALLAETLYFDIICLIQVKKDPDHGS